MKLSTLFFSLTLSMNALAVNVVVCEGKIGSQDVTVLDDGRAVGIFLGRVNVAAGPRGNSARSVVFRGQEISFDEGEELCTLTASASERGSFTLEAPCDGNGEGAIKSANIPELSIAPASAIPVTCRKETYEGSRGSRPENRGSENNRSRRERTEYCREPGSSHAPGGRRPPGSSHDPANRSLPVCEE